MKYDNAFELILITEGGYVNDKSDAGGETIFGIARRSHPKSKIFELLDYWKSKGNTDPKILTKMAKDSEIYYLAKEIYQKEYWNKCRCDELPDLHRYPLFDCAVNLGVKQACKLYQRALFVKDDGVIGPKTIAAAKATNPDSVLRGFFERWGEFYTALAESKPSNQKFLQGWRNRIKHAKANNS